MSTSREKQGSIGIYITSKNAEAQSEIVSLSVSRSWKAVLVHQARFGGHLPRIVMVIVILVISSATADGASTTIDHTMRRYAVSLCRQSQQISEKCACYIKLDILVRRKIKTSAKKGPGTFRSAIITFLVPD